MFFDPRDRDDGPRDRADDRGRNRDSQRRDVEDDRGLDQGADPRFNLPHRDPRDRDDDSRDRDHDARTLGRGPGDDSRSSAAGEHPDDPRRDARWPDRERDVRTRVTDPRDTFTRQVRLPRGPEREIIRYRDREYTLRGSETRALAAVGAFRVVSSRDLRDSRDREYDPRRGDLRHLREQGLVETVRVPGSREHAVALSKDGHRLLERNRAAGDSRHQTFWDGLKRERELGHDLQVYRAYERAADRLAARDARIERVVLDHELKRDYQSWLHERDRERGDYDGHPDRTQEEIRDWALEHDLPYFDDELHFPDLRIEYQEPDGRWVHDDIEVITEHYRGAHAASVARSGFACYGGYSLRIGGARGGGGGGGRRYRGHVEELFD